MYLVLIAFIADSFVWLPYFIKNAAITVADFWFPFWFAIVNFFALVLSYLRVISLFPSPSLSFSLGSLCGSLSFERPGTHHSPTAPQHRSTIGGAGDSQDHPDHTSVDPYIKCTCWLCSFDMPSLWKNTKSDFVF